VPKYVHTCCAVNAFYHPLTMDVLLSQIAALQQAPLARLRAEVEHRNELFDVL